MDPLIRVGAGLGLTAEEKADIVAFLLTLSDPDFSSPFPESPGTH